MRIILLSLLLLLVSACHDDDAVQEPNDRILVRVTNNTNFVLHDIRFGFNGFENLDGFVENPLQVGAASDFEVFDWAGSCDAHVEFTLPGGGPTVQAQTPCLCLCPLDVGEYEILVAAAPSPSNGYRVEVVNL